MRIANRPARPGKRMGTAGPPRRSGERGFTLLELLVVIAILGLLIAFVGPRVMTLFGSSKQKIAAQSLTQLADVLEFYRLDIGGYPTNQQGLQALLSPPAGLAQRWHGPYLKGNAKPLDPWGRPFQYHIPSRRPGHAFDLYTLGADGRPGGSGEDADLYNE